MAKPLLTEAEHRNRAGEHLQAREDSFARCDTDGFVSQYCHGLQAQLEERKASLAANNGTAEFRGLFDRQTGKRVAAKLINGRFGYCWAFCDESGEFTGRFLGDSKGTKRSAMYREGFEVRMEQAPANAVLESPPGATGFSGLSSVYVKTYRTDGGYPVGAKVVR